MKKMRLKIFILTLLALSVLKVNADPIRIGLEPPTKEGHDPRVENFKAKINQFFEKKKQEVHFVELPIKRLYAFLLSDRIHFKFPDNPKWKKEFKSKKTFYYSRKLYTTRDITVRHKDNFVEAPEIKTLGIIRGYTPEPFLKRVTNKQVRIMEVNDMKSLIGVLSKKRVDAIYVNEDIFNAHHPSKEIFNLESVSPITETNYHLSTIHYPELLKELDSFLKKE